MSSKAERVAKRMSTYEELPDVQNSAWKDNKNRFGYKFLSKFGWSDEKGLGKNETGITSAVKIKRREDELGLGMEKLTDGAGNMGWNQTTNGFNSVLESLKNEYGNKDSDKSSKKAKSKKRSANLTVGIKCVLTYFTNISLETAKKVNDEYLNIYINFSDR